MTSGEQADANALTSIAQSQNERSGQLFSLAFPNLAQASSFYQTLSTGDPFAISRAIAPAAQQVNAQTQSAKQNIMNNAPAGGEKNLALEQADVSQGAQIGNLASQGYLNSFNNLAQLGGATTGQSNAFAGTSVGALGQASHVWGQLGDQQVQQKGATLGALGQLGGSLAYLGGNI